MSSFPCRSISLALNLGKGTRLYSQKSTKTAHMRVSSRFRVVENLRKASEAGHSASSSYGRGQGVGIQTPDHQQEPLSRTYDLSDIPAEAPAKVDVEKTFDLSKAPNEGDVSEDVKEQKRIESLVRWSDGGVYYDNYRVSDQYEHKFLRPERLFQHTARKEKYLEKLERKLARQEQRRSKKR